MSLKGRVALVTGASRGIGRATALALAAEGAEVYVNYSTHRELAEGTLSLIEERGGKGYVLGFDVSDSDAVAKAVDEIVSRSRKIDVLVNNAGITRDGLAMRMKESDWDAVFDVNLKGAFLVTKAAIRHMIKAKYGRIVNLSSVVGQSGREGQVNYASSKAGIEGFTKSLARELAARNITVNAVAPGFIETDLTANLNEKAKAGILEGIPLRRFGTPEEVASVVTWLVGDGASYITGAVIPVNGGIYT